MKAIDRKEFWERKAQEGYFLNYDKVGVNPRMTEGYMYVEEILKNMENPRILEIGCGGGKETSCLAIFGNDISVVDLSKTALKLVKERFSQVKTFELSNDTLPFKDNSFDFVFSAYVFQHNPVETMRWLLLECERVLKPSGRALVEFLGKREGVELKEKEHVEGIYSIGLEFKELLDMVEGAGIDWLQIRTKKQYQYNPGFLNFWLEFRKRR
jgi:ubiquinone/menaquinone biosynthesis C-methylase UbiE